MAKLNVVVVIAVLALIAGGCVETQKSSWDFSQSQVIVKPEVIHALQNQSKVYVTVMLKDDSNITYGDTNEELVEKRLKYEKRAAYFQKSEEEVISTMSASEFQLDYKFSIMNAFSGYISKEGIEKLKANPKVSSIEGDGVSKVG